MWSGNSGCYLAFTNISEETAVFVQSRTMSLCEWTAKSEREIDSLTTPLQSDMKAQCKPLELSSGVSPGEMDEFIVIVWARFIL